MRSDVVVGAVCEMNELPTQTAADRDRSGASEAMAKE